MTATVTSPLRGFLNIDKPAGITSFEVVRRIRRAAGTRKVGHAGTLDPAATGVLPIAVGEATKLIEALVDARKRYRAEVTLGRSTDTYDAEGEVTAEADASELAGVTEAAVRAALAPFSPTGGEIMQRPPAYSAVKRDGVPAYRAARQGKPLDLDPRPVMVHSIDVLEFRAASEGGLASVTLDVASGKGFYVRSLADDLGTALGVGGHLASLRRTRVGPFEADDATTLEAAVALLEAGETDRLVHAADLVLTGWPAVLLSAGDAGRVRQGLDVSALSGGLLTAQAAAGVERARGYDSQGRLVALLEPGSAPGTWHPYRVMPGG